MQLENNLFLSHFHDLAKSLQPRPHPTPSPCRSRAGFGKPKKLAPLEGGKARHSGDVCVVCCALIYIPNLRRKSMRKFFAPAQTLKAVFMLII